MYYQNVQTIRPNDAVIVNAINRTLELQQLDEKLQKLSALAVQQSEIKQLRREKAELKKQIQDERERLKEIARQREEAEIELAAKKAEVREVQASLAASHRTPDLGIALKSEDDGISDLITLDAKIVEETLIDGGQKKYVYKEKPKLPPGVKSKEMTMILAECVVGVDGSKTENVNIPVNVKKTYSSRNSRVPLGFLKIATQ